MMKKDTIIKTMRLWKCAGIRKPVCFRSIHRFHDLPMKYSDFRCQTKDELATVLFDLSIYEWGISELRFCKGWVTIAFEMCVNWSEKHRDTNIDAAVVESIMPIVG